MGFNQRQRLTHVEEIIIDVFLENKNTATESDVVDAFLEKFPENDFDRATQKIRMLLQQLKVKEIITQVRNDPNKRWMLTNRKF